MRSVVRAMMRDMSCTAREAWLLLTPDERVRLAFEAVDWYERRRARRNKTTGRDLGRLPGITAEVLQ